MADTMALLHRLRRLHVEQAKRVMAGALAAERAAELAATAANAALRREAAEAPGDAAHPIAPGYGAWLPSGQAALRSARASQNEAALWVDNARAQLAGVRAEECAIAHVCRERDAAAQARAMRKQQAALESVAAGISNKP